MRTQARPLLYLFQGSSYFLSYSLLKKTLVLPPDLKSMVSIGKPWILVHFQIF